METQPTTAPDAMVGKTIGNYIVRYQLGEGGMGSVYFAEHPSIGKRVALKVLHVEFASQPEIVSRFLNEAKAVNDIQHPNTVRKEQPSARPKLVVTRLTGGQALISAGDLGIPVQPAFGLVGGYPIHLAPVTVEVGAALSYTPLPYVVMDEQKRGVMLGFRATAVASYQLVPRLSVRGDFGFGILSLSGLEDGNPISTSHRAGSFTLPSIGIGVAVDYELAPNIAPTVSPLSLAFSPGAEGMYANSLREIDVVVGIGYRQ